MAHTDLIAHIQAAVPDLSPTIAAAFARVPRAAFVPDHVDEDESVPIKVTLDGVVISASSQPSLIAALLQQLAIRPGDNVLEIGAGSGYSAALMQQLVGSTGRVTTTEIDPQVAEITRGNLHRARMGVVSVVTGDGAHGYAPRAAYDRIAASAAVWDVPRTWLRQLRPSGRLVVPIALDGVQVSAAFTANRDGSLTSTDNRPCHFVWMRGQRAPTATLRVGSTLYVDATAPLDTAALGQFLRVDAEDGYLPYPRGPVDLWGGFLPYLGLILPEEAQIVRYTSVSGEYGIVTGEGFGVIAPGSACFVHTTMPGADDDAAINVRYFGAAEMYIMLQEAIAQWVKEGRPDRTRLRLRLIPIEAQPSGTMHGRLFRRRDHLLQVWFEMG